MEYLFFLLSNIYCLTACIYGLTAKRKEILIKSDNFTSAMRTAWAIFCFSRSLLEFALEVLWVLQVCSSLFVICLCITENVHPHFLDNDLCLSSFLHELMYNNWRLDDQNSSQNHVVSIFRCYHRAEQVCSLTVLWNREFHKAWGQAALKDSS